MHMRLSIGGYEIEFDQAATAGCYAAIPVPGPEACGCAYCRNWVAAREQVLPSKLKDILSQLGIPSDGEIEVWEAPAESRPHLYGGWYLFVGRVVSGEIGQEFTIDGFRLSFAVNRSYAVAAFAWQQVCELVFITEIDEFLPEAEYTSPPKPVSHVKAERQTP